MAKEKAGYMAPVVDKDLLSFTRSAMFKYGSETNLERAIPDFRDGFKPVQRRIVWSMSQIANKHQVKSKRISGDCFAPGTLVTLSNGTQVPIEELIVGDQVLTDTGIETVSKTFVLEGKDLYEVSTDKGKVLATSDQIFYCIDADDKEVERTPLTLKPGDRIKSLK
jgi:hypothetical protein